MFMARSSADIDFRKGPIPGPIQQLPSFSQFLSGAQQAESSAPHLGLSTFETQDGPPPFQNALFRSHNELSRHQLKPNHLQSQSSQQVDYQQAGGRPLLPQATRSPTQTDLQTPSQLPGPHPYRPHYDSPSPHESVPRISAPPDIGPTKSVVSETDIEGKGPCYVYNDGTLCPKAVDGDAVNPKWGTTKAGKPRKRLGQACNTCREKKIRCDPQLPKCAQCQKFGRECRFETGSKGSHRGNSGSARASPTTPELKKDAWHDRHGSSVSAETPSEQLYSRDNSRSSINVEPLLSPSSTVVSEDAPPSKKRRLSESSKAEQEPVQYVQPNFAPNRPTTAEPIVRRQLQFSNATNPLEVDRRLTLRYIQKYLTDINAKLYHILPRQKFVDWVENARAMTDTELLVLYAIMAFGATYAASEDSDHIERAQVFTGIAEDILQQHSDGADIYLLFGQLILSFQTLSGGDTVRSKRLTEATLRMCYHMRMHKEDGLDHLVQKGMPCFGLDARMAKECMRRIFWLTYTGHCFLKYSVDERRDVESLQSTLRLPCDDVLYDRGEIPALPIFQHSMTDIHDLLATPGHGMIAFLVGIALILDEVTNFQQMITPSYQQAYESFYQKTKPRLLAWDKYMRKYLSRLQRATHSVEGSDAIRPISSEEQSHTGPCGLHLLYHFVTVALHRHVVWEQLSPEQIERCIKESHHHAERTLALANQLDEDGEPTTPGAKMARNCPIASLAVFTAADVITAAGTVSDVFEHQNDGREHGFKEMLSFAIVALEELSRYWQPAEAQSKLVAGRLRTILFAVSGQTSTTNAFFFRDAMYSPFGRDHDIVYGLSRLEYFKARGLGHRVRRESDLTEVGVQSPK